jgi:hypothetical protein
MRPGTGHLLVDFEPNRYSGLGAFPVLVFHVNLTWSIFAYSGIQFAMRSDLTEGAILTDFLVPHGRETLVEPGPRPSLPYSVDRMSIGKPLPVGRPSPSWILGVPYLRNPWSRSGPIEQKHAPTVLQYGVQTSRSSLLPVPT